MEKNELIKKLWNGIGKGKYIRVNKKDGSLPTIKEFEKMIQQNAN